MTILRLHLVLGLMSGVLVGFTLGLAGGGGSVLAVPLLVYFVGTPNPHEAIGTSAAAVAANALLNLVHYARAGVIKWRCASIFALFGSIGAYAGSTFGKLVDGQRLPTLFGVLMIVVSILMLRGRDAEGFQAVRLNRENFPRLVAAGLTSGALSGFFGVGGGFLIVPGLMFASGMPILNAVGSSLVAVSAFAVTTAVELRPFRSRRLGACRNASHWRRNWRPRGRGGGKTACESTRGAECDVRRPDIRRRNLCVVAGGGRGGFCRS